jgi:hypothetical protein
MYRYKYDQSYNHKSKRSRRSVRLAVFVCLLILGGAGYIAYDVFRQTNNADSQTSQTTIAQVQGENVTLVRTPYFQFQLPKNWKEIAGESKDGHYVYRSFRSGIIEEELDIEVNDKTSHPINSYTTSHVLPLNYDGSQGAFIVAQRIGDPCQKVYPKNPVGELPDDARLVKQYGVSFVCNPGSGFYQAVLGLVGGSEDMVVNRPSDNESIKLHITYRNVMMTPNPEVIYTIVNSFRVL